MPEHGQNRAVNPSLPGGRSALFGALAAFPIGSALERAPEGGGGSPELSFPVLLLLLAAGLAVLLAVATQVRVLRRKRDSSLASLAGGWPGPAATLDAEERFLSANQTFLETFALKEDELQTKHLREVLGPESHEALRPRVLEALEGKVAVTPEGFTPSSPSRGRFGATLIPRRGPDGAVDGFHALLCGAGAEGRPGGPEMKAAEERGNDDQTVAERDAFLSRIAHDLRTPLQSILGWTGLVRTGKLSGSESARALEVIESNARTLARLIDEILDHSLVVRGQLRLETRKLDLVPLVRETIESLRQAVDSKGVALEASTSPATVPAVGDPDRLQQVVHILVLNALKFTPRGGKVQVSARSSPGQSCITVEDSGPGLPPEVIPDLFTSPLLRWPRDGRGLGLGLVTARYLVELHGGSIRAGNREGGAGAVMTICLPVKEPVQVSAPEPWAPVFESHRVYAGTRAATGESRILEGLRVLAVDDDEDTRKLLEVVLEKYGAEVKSVASAAEALKEVTAETGPRPDVIICDIAMPEESGYDLIHKVRMLKPERGGKIPAIALTGYSSGVDRMRALAAGFQNHVAKPIEPRELSTVIASIAHRGL